ncbi:MAG: hypothetical protein HC919_11210 [Oscillatoriales cyanobacterium SM2_2_1]|nr:hypothetical protein [Oscillatoriales cyanobacterium SM2_2_1]
MNGKQSVWGAIWGGVLGQGGILLGIAVLLSSDPALARFIVFVPSSQATLESVRRVSPDAFRTVYNSQSVIQAGFYTNELAADELVARLRLSGFSAQKGLRDGVIAQPPSPLPPGIEILPPVTSPLPPLRPTPAPTFPGEIGVINPPIAGTGRYVAAIPTTNTFALSQVRQFVPGAMIANSSRGAYIMAGAFDNRNAAESLVSFLRSRGLDARVVFF